VRLKRTNNGNKRRSSRLTSGQALDSTIQLDNDCDSDASLIVISRPKKKRYSNGEGTIRSPIKGTQSKAVVTLTTDLVHAPSHKSNHVQTNQQLTPVQNFKMFRKPSFELKKTASLESLENGNISVILTSPEVAAPTPDKLAAKPRSADKKKAKSNKKDGQKISDFFEKSPPKTEQSDENVEFNASVIAIERVVSKEMERKPTRMVDFSEMFQKANLRAKTDEKSVTQTDKKAEKKKNAKSRIKTSEKLKSNSKETISLTRKKPEAPPIDDTDETTGIASPIIDLLDIVSDDDATIVHGGQFSNDRTESVNSLPKPVDLPSQVVDSVWTTKHSPKSADESVCSNVNSEFVKNWILNYNNKYGDNSSDNSGSEEYEVDEDDQKELCLLIAGPVGSGKTSLVYAIAQEINHKVFEMNCSSKRNSKTVNKLREVTLSHTVSRKEKTASVAEATKSTKESFLKNFLKGRSSCLSEDSKSSNKSKSIATFFTPPAKPSKTKFDAQTSDSQSSMMSGFTCESNSQSNALSLNANSM
jgi:hypothetical protein